MPWIDFDFNLSKLIYMGLKLAEIVLAAIYLGVVSYHTTVTVSGEVFVYGHTKVMSFVTVTAGFMVPTFLLLVIQFHAQSADKQRKSIFGCLKHSAIYLGVVSYHTTVTVSGEVFVYGHTKVMSFVTVTAGFMVPTFLLLVIQFHAQSADKQRKSIFEMLYNVSAVVFLVAASTTMLSFTERLPENFPGQGSWRAGGIMGLINCAFYSASAVLSFIEYKKD